MANGRKLNKAWVLIAILVVALAIWYILGFSAAAHR
jgi:hypothetical protein